MKYSCVARIICALPVTVCAAEPIEGFTLDDCPEITGDSIEHTVRWNQGTDVSSLAGKPVRLPVVLKDADLFSLQFTSSE